MMPEPTTRSLTVLEPSTSLATASPETFVFENSIVSIPLRLEPSSPTRPGARGCRGPLHPRRWDSLTQGTGAVAQRTTTRTRSLAAVVLAAGKGKRLKSARPKVLHPICGEPALWHVLEIVGVAKPDKIVIVVGHGADEVRSAVETWDIAPKPVFVEQA